MNCQGCGAERDSVKQYLYPYPDDGIDTSEPISLLFKLDCQGPPIPDHPQGYSEYRTALVCHSCFHRLEPDMWISEACWKRLSPVVPYEKLPLLDLDTAGDRWDPRSKAAKP